MRRHTFYETRWGPVFSFQQAGLTWGTEHAYALADVNADNFRLVNQWEQYDRAQSVADLRRANRRVQGNPWTNTIAADSAGNAYYADESVVPNVDADLQSRCSSDNPITPLLLTQGVVLLDGSRSRCRWGNDRDALAQGHHRPARPAARDAHGLRGELQRLLLAAERALPAHGLPADHRRRGHAAAAAHAARR